MKSTKLKVSISQDGLLPQETQEIVTLSFPSLPKKLLKALGFERVDAKTFVGVLPVFINLEEKYQEIEIELGITLPEMRKKVIEMIKAQTKPDSSTVPAKEEKKKVKKPVSKARQKKPQTKTAKSATPPSKKTTGGRKTKKAK